MNWLDALKIWNKNNDKWKIPKKLDKDGNFTKDYLAVKKIMGDTSISKKSDKKKKVKTVSQSKTRSVKTTKKKICFEIDVPWWATDTDEKF